MPDYRHILDKVVKQDLEGSSISSTAARTLDMPHLLRWEPNKVEASWECSPDYLNSRGVLFGGYYAVLADAVLAFASMTVLDNDEVYSTQDLQLSFFKPVSRGIISIPAEVVTRTRSRVYTECRFIDAAGAVLAVASAAQHTKRVGAAAGAEDLPE